MSNPSVASTSVGDPVNDRSSAGSGSAISPLEFAQLFASSDRGFLRIDSRGAIIDANDFLLGQLQLSVGDLTKLKFWDLARNLPPEIGPRLLERLVRTGHLRSADFSIPRGDRHPITFQIRYLGQVGATSDLIECSPEPVDVDEPGGTEGASTSKLSDQRTLCSDHFEVTAQREIDHVRDKGTPLAMLSIAIDRIGVSANERSASTAQLLSGFASTCAAVLRTTDIVSRVEDAVYVALLPSTSTRAARCAAERLRTAIAAMGSIAQNGAMRRVTVSIGVVATRTGRTTYRAMRSRADSKRDDAAHIGGNRVSA